MTHNKYFFSGKLEAVRQNPAGGNVRQEFVPETDPNGPHEADVVPVVTTADNYGAPSFNINPMLLEVIRMDDFFIELSKYTTYSDVIDQVYYNVKYVTPWVPGVPPRLTRDPRDPPQASASEPP